MHPLVKRLLIRGPIVFVICYVLGWGLSQAAVVAIRMLNNQNTTVEIDNTGGGFFAWSFVNFGLAGVVVLALLEWLSHAREQWRKKP